MPPALFPAFAVALILTAPAGAQETERCPKLVAEAPARLVPAAFRVAQLQPEEVRLTFIGHATFLIESPKGVKIATDYNGYVRPAVTPDIVTMNRAHSTHYTDFPEPEIKYVLRGWTATGEPARHDLSVEDVWVSNVTTDIRDFSGDAVRDGNSIFLFEVSGLCIAHLGHLHHKLDPRHVARIGRIDVVLVPVDGSYTLNQEEMIEVLGQLAAPLMVPMHYFGRATLDRFLGKLGERYEVEWSDSPSVTLSRASLPVKPKVLVLPGR